MIGRGRDEARNWCMKWCRCVAVWLQEERARGNRGESGGRSGKPMRGRDLATEPVVRGKSSICIQSLHVICCRRGCDGLNFEAQPPPDELSGSSSGPITIDIHHKVSLNLKLSTGMPQCDKAQSRAWPAPFEDKTCLSLPPQKHPGHISGSQQTFGRTQGRCEHCVSYVRTCK